jgi:hypothetical protein
VKTAAPAQAKEAPAKQQAAQTPAPALKVPQPLVAPGTFIQRKCACGGGCPRCEEEALAPVPIQPKLVVNAPGDRYEHEADRVAEHVTGTAPAPASAPVWSISRVIQQQADPAPGLSDSGPAGTMRTPSAISRGRAPPAQDSIESRISARRGYGSPLSGPALRFMESRFDADFSDVRIHADSDAHALNHDLHAYAFTTGRDIFFAEGQYRPGTGEGNRLLAHELTHVLQQSGGAARETRVQTAGWGEAAHKGVQERLILENSDLMCEVHIPGALSPDSDENVGFDEDRLSVRGFSDFYRSDSNLVSGVRSVKTDPKNPEAVGVPPHKYFNIGTKNKRRIFGASPIYSPKIKSRRPYVWDASPGFPPTFEIGELKPLFAEQFPAAAATGMLQVSAYTEGLAAFAGQVRDDSGVKTTVIPSGSPMQFKWGQGSGKRKAIRIPVELDLNKKRQQPASPDPDKVFLRHGKKERVWVVADPKEEGVLRYVSLPDPLAAAGSKTLLTRDQELQKILDFIKKQKQPKFENKLDKKSKPGPPPQNTLIQRKTCDAPNADLTGTWKEQWCVFETQRAQWSGSAKTPGSASEFLATEGEARKREVDADAKAGIGTPAEAQEKTTIKHIELWAGRSGWLLGLLRFRFGALFERVADLFGRIKTKFVSFRDTAKIAVEGGSWEKKAIQVIGEALIIFLKTLVSKIFQIASDCVHGIADKIIDYYLTELSEEVLKVLEPAREKFEQLQKDLEEKYAPFITAVTDVLKTIDKVRQVLSMLADIEWGLRILIEAISCASPPALGCLWGLVAQIGFDLAAAKAIGTNLFRTRIAEPAALKLLDATGIGDRIRTFISSIVGKIGFGDLVKTVQVCQPQPPLGGPRLSRDNMNVSNTDPDVVKARNELEKERPPDAMIEDLKKIMVSDDKPASKEEIEELVRKFRESKLSPDEFKKLLQKTKKGKIDVQQSIQQFAPPPTPPSTGPVQQPPGGGTGPGRPGGATGPLMIPASSAQQVLLKADWSKVPPGSFYLDKRHSPPLLLFRLSGKVRFGALVQFKEVTEKGRAFYEIVDSGQVILLDDAGPDEAIEYTPPGGGLGYVSIAGMKKGQVIRIDFIGGRIAK